MGPWLPPPFLHRAIGYQFMVANAGGGAALEFSIWEMVVVTSGIR